MSEDWKAVNNSGVNNDDNDRHHQLRIVTSTVYVLQHERRSTNVHTYPRPVVSAKLSVSTQTVVWTVSRATCSHTVHARSVSTQLGARQVENSCNVLCSNDKLIWTTVGRLSWLVSSFWLHVKIASRIASYRVHNTLTLARCRLTALLCDMRNSSAVCSPMCLSVAWI